MAEEEKKEKKGFWKEFAEFINRGNVMDMAVGVIVGGGFTTVVNSLVDDIITPLISIVTGGSTDVPGLAITVNGISIDFGAFIGAIINFLITALCIFAIIKGLNALNAAKDSALQATGLKKEEEAAPEPPAPRTCPYCLSEIPDAATRCPHCTAKLEGYLNPQEDK